MAPHIHCRPTAEYRTKEYHAWIRMIHRCHNADYDGFATYGGRGIWVCDRWRDSYDAFLLDMGRAPHVDLSIERIDNDGGYCCGRPTCLDCRRRGIRKTNCRWATKTEQARNRRTNVIITYRGLKKTMVEWAEFLHITRKCLWKRLQLHAKNPDNWPWERIMASPVPVAWPDQRRAA